MRALVASDGGLLAHYFGMIGQLTPPQIRVALNLALPDVPALSQAIPRGGLAPYSCASRTAARPSRVPSRAPRSTPRHWSLSWGGRRGGSSG